MRDKIVRSLKAKITSKIAEKIKVKDDEMFKVDCATNKIMKMSSIGVHFKYNTKIKTVQRESAGLEIQIKKILSQIEARKVE